MSAETISCPVRWNAERLPESPALITHGHTLSWAELDELVGSTAAYLHEIAPSGARIAVQMPNSPEFVTLILAALRTGHVLAPISTRLPSVATEAIQKLVDAAHVMTDASSSHPLILSSSQTGRTTVAAISLARPATIVQTSGSMGASKAVLHTVGNHVWSARGLAEIILLKPSDRWLLSLSLYHVGGLAIVYRCALGGAAIVLPEAGTTVGGSIESLGVTHASLVSTQLYRLLREKTASLDSLKAVLLGGSAIPPNLVDEAFAWGLPVHASYGLTEMASTVAVAPADDSTSAGSILPHRELAIRDGEIHVRGRTCFAGYVDADALFQPFDDEGWFATGDLGFLDENDRLHVTGRMDNQFISGGENIQPEEIEKALETLSGVVQSMVVPVADAEYGYRPVAFVRIEGGGLDPQTTLAALEATLPRFKLPEAIYAWPEFEGTKPSRATLRQEAERRGLK